MKKKELLAMKELLATKAMLTVASENPIEKEERKTSWGNLKRELRREKFHKMDLKAVMKIGGRKRVPPATILRRLQRYPYMEYLQKSGLEKLMEEIIISENDETLCNGDAARIHEVLQLDKQRFQRMKKMDGGCRTLRALQYEQQTGKKVSDENIIFLENENANVKELIEITDRTKMNVERTVNYLKRQMDMTEESWISIVRYYKDYAWNVIQ